MESHFEGIVTNIPIFPGLERYQLNVREDTPERGTYKGKHLFYILETITRYLMDMLVIHVLQDRELPQNYIIFGGQSLNAMTRADAMTKSYDYDIHMFGPNALTTRHPFGAKLVHDLNLQVNRIWRESLYNVLLTNGFVTEQEHDHYLNDQLFYYTKRVATKERISYVIAIDYRFKDHFLTADSDKLVYISNSRGEPYQDQVDYEEPVTIVPEHNQLYWPIVEMLIDAQVNYGFQVSEENVVFYDQSPLHYLDPTIALYNLYMYTRTAQTPFKRQKNQRKLDTMSVPKNYSTQFLMNFDLKRAYRVLDWIRTTISPATYIGFSDAPISTSEGLETCDHVEQLLAKIQKYRDQYIANIERHLVLTKGHGCQYPLVEVDEYTYEVIYNNVDPSMVQNLASINDYHQQMLWKARDKDARAESSARALSASSQEISNYIAGENHDLLQDSLNSDIFDTYRVGNDFIFKSHEGCVTTLESYYEKHFAEQLIYCPQFQMLSPTTNFDYSALVGQGSYLLHVILAKTYLRRWIPICDAGRCSILIDKETYLLTLGIEYKVVEINGLHKDILVIHALALDSLDDLARFNEARKGNNKDIQIGCGRGHKRRSLPPLVCVNIDPQKTPKIKTHQVINTGQLMIDVVDKPYTDLYDSYTGIFMSYQRQEVLKGVSSVMGLTKPNVNKVVTRLYGKKQLFTRPQLHQIIETLTQPAAQVAGGGT
jgi:hypothetical protein